jgi:hypothetical protein
MQLPTREAVIAASIAETITAGKTTSAAAVTRQLAERVVRLEVATATPAFIFATIRAFPTELQAPAMT